jgi:hypothetical protein
VLLAAQKRALLAGQLAAMAVLLLSLAAMVLNKPISGPDYSRLERSQIPPAATVP